MDLKILIISVLLKFTSSMPDPNVNVNVDVNVEDRDGCNGCTLGCVWDFKAYPNGAHTEDTCMILKCNKGTWEYTGIIRHGCGECQVYGDPHFEPFDNHTFPIGGLGLQPENGRTGYDYMGNGTFTLISHGLDDSSFGVNSEFVACGNDNPDLIGEEGAILSCVAGASYYELGILVTLKFPYDVAICKGSDDPLCQIQVNVNTELVNIGKGVDLFHATDGTVAVFQHNHIATGDLNCMNIVGSKGLSLSLCAHNRDYAFLYVWAMPSLRDKTSSQLYGLCDTYTGNKPDCYTHRNGSCSTTVTDPYYEKDEVNKEICDFAKSWSLSGEAKCSTTVPSSPCDTNATLKEEISTKCNETLPVPPETNNVKRAACLFDLCRVPDIESYLKGYMYHAQVEEHFASHPCYCPPNCYGDNICCMSCISN